MEVVLANNAPQKTTSISVESLDHISIAVPDLAQAIDLYREKFGCVVSKPMELPEPVSYTHLTLPTKA